MSTEETAENIAPVQSNITNKQTNTKCQLKKPPKISLLFRIK